MYLPILYMRCILFNIGSIHKYSLLWCVRWCILMCSVYYSIYASVFIIFCVSTESESERFTHTMCVCVWGIFNHACNMGFRNSWWANNQFKMMYECALQEGCHISLHLLCICLHAFSVRVLLYTSVYFLLAMTHFVFRFIWEKKCQHLRRWLTTIIDII